MTKTDDPAARRREMQEEIRQAFGLSREEMEAAMDPDDAHNQTVAEAKALRRDFFRRHLQHDGEDE